MERNQKNKEKGNGEGTLYTNKKTGLLVGQYCYNGKRKSIYQKKNEKTSDFKKRFNKIITEVNEGTHIETQKISFYTILSNHIEQKYKDNLVGPSTYNRDLNTKKQIEKTCENFIYKPIDKITVYDIEYAKDYIKKYSDTCIKKIWEFIIKVFKIALSRRLIAFNIMNDENLTKPISIQEQEKVEAFSLSEEKELLNYLDSFKDYEQYKYIVLLQLHTGMRISEILALKRSKVDLKNNTITVDSTLTKDENGKYIIGTHTKTYDRKHNVDRGKRTFPIPEKAIPLLKEIIKHSTLNINDLLFWDDRRNSLILPRRILNFLQNKNKDFTTHRVRHTFITRCQEAGIPLVVIQSIVGHVEGSSITSDIYTSVSLDFMKNELKKLSNAI